MALRLDEKTGLEVSLGVVAAGMISWLIFLSLTLFEIRQDVAVLKNALVPHLEKVAVKP